MYDFQLLNAASTTNEFPSDLAAVAASTGTSLWVVAVVAAGIPLGLFILAWVIARFRSKAKVG